MHSIIVPETIRAVVDLFYYLTSKATAIVIIIYQFCLLFLGKTLDEIQ